MIKFGTGGWRAVIGDEFTKENIQILSRAIADKMKEEGVKSEGIVLGYDRRFLSKEAMQWAGQVFAAQGIKASLINQSVPTPLVMFYVMKHRLHYGMMITASHNPAIYNGIKVFTYGGRDADERQTMEIEAYIEDVTDIPVEEMAYSKAKEAGLIEEIYPLNEYLDNIITAVDMNAIRRRHLRIALDPMYGVSETSLKTILLTARCDVAAINGRHDTLFGGKLPAPNADTLRSLQLYVLERHCDIGLATDGDADRIGVIDDEGRFLHPNDIMVLLYFYLVRYKGWKGPVVRNICTTHVLDREAAAFGEVCYEVPVGFKHISAKMQATDAVIGGESSGGLTVRGHIHGKDGIYAAALLVEMISVTGKKLSELYRDVQEEFGKVYMEERSYKFTDEKKESIYKILLEDKELPELPCEIDRVSYLDGCKVYFKNGGWISARFSGTEPLLRIFCEMDRRADAANICEIFEKYLEIFTGA
ncbi:phosphoglucomutase/phosphomannomutase family protein [Muricomes intestini]|jgi:phosphomannomutase|uniref:Phosphoglucomutase n=1 Tax=Muricomes intestini TaxID=1796634 RepID=A0A4V2US00_9FIRM|nr:phosphoglucomutase/phosphomannomutase family protein [Muricomes intestini]TCS79512.1 phosphomannomutase [Muricomes intestini]HAX53463.1 phosphonomutase [Lachnospiraceae bacterium]HCR84139.1 phosphonomutase [Lachnospiraceae bacterium]